MLTRYPFMSRLLLIVVLPLSVLVASTFAYLSGSVTDKEGQVILAGLDSPVLVETDSMGVPSVTAKTDKDGFFTLGYLHAKDRLWQLELQKRIAAGRLSEVFGKRSLQQDIWFRTLGLYASAQQAWQHLSKPAKDSLEAYAAGVNAYLAKKNTLPIEFITLSVEPEPWTPIDSLAWMKVFALNLDSSWSKELARQVSGQLLDGQKLATLFPEYAKDAPVTVKTDKSIALMQLHDSISDTLKIGGELVGSNAWVVDGRFTESGHPIITNDPHIGLTLPSAWYVASVKGDKLNISGMTMVGLPLVAFGRNDHIAWGGTSMQADVQDLYLEQFDGDKPDHYLTRQGAKPLKQRTEQIHVRADFPDFLRSDLEPVEVLVRSTENGPLISDVVGAFNRPVALRWTGLDADDTSYQALFQLNYANDWQSFTEALSFHVGPTLNILYADKHNIGYQAVGRIPVRKNHQGLLPIDANHPDSAWVDYIVADDLPFAFNPEQGWLVNANNKIVDDSYPYFISHDWAQPYRAERIEQLLKKHIGEGPIKANTMQSVIADVKDLSADLLLPELLKTLPQTERQRKALTLLKNWDGQMNGDSAAAAIMHSWLRHLHIEMLEARLKLAWNHKQADTFIDSVIRKLPPTALLNMLQDRTLGWCSSEADTQAPNCQQKRIDSLVLALDELQRIQGSNLAAWRWSQAHKTEYQHMPFTHINLLDVIFDREVENGGSVNTINVASSYFDAGEGYRQNFGPSFRQIMQLGESQTTHLYMNSTGQSGNIFSQHYDDMIRPFAEVEFISLNRAASQKQLQLIPAGQERH